MNDERQQDHGPNADDATMPGAGPPLSPAGERRRDAIFNVGLRGLDRRRRRRRVVRATAVGAAIAVASGVGAVVVMSVNRRGPAPSPIATTRPAAPSTPVVVAEVPRTPAVPMPRGRTESVVVVVRPDPAITARYTARPAIGPVTSVTVLSDDDALLRALADAGRPAALSYQPDGSTVVLYR